MVKITFSTDSLMISSLFYMIYVCVTVLIQFIKEMTISERTFIQKNMESNITNCRSLQSNIIITFEKSNSLYYLVTLKVNILRNLVTK